MAKTIILNMGDKNPTSLLHTLHSVQSRRAEINDLQKHLDHIENTKKVLSEEKAKYYSDRMNGMKNSLQFFNGRNAEMTLWSAEKIEVGTVIDMKFYKKTFTVTQVASVQDHSGRFKVAEHKRDTHYVLYGNIHWYGKEEADKAAAEKNRVTA